MRRNSMKWVLVSVLVIITACTTTVFGQNQVKQIIDPKIPESWYHAPRLASEMGITEFKQSPMLDERVASGELPPVKERLPEDPPVIEPYEKVGKYGGTIVSWQAGMDWGEIWETSETYAYLGAPEIDRAKPDMTDTVPYLAKGWEYSDDYRTFTLYLHKGHKWSDGHPFTADDYIYWWQHVATNKDLNPIPPEKWNPPILNVEKIDEVTVRFYLGKPSPFFHRNNAYALDEPKHYMQQFHPDFVDMDELMKEARRAGFDHWYEYYQYRKSETYPERGLRPTLRPYVVVNRSNTHVEAERNPYYPFVDTEGNQLPYVDKVVTNRATDREMINTKCATGEVGFAGRDLDPANIPLFKQTEASGGHRCLLYTALGTDFVVYVNVTHRDPELRKILGDVRFRKALSLAMNRDEINQKVYFGLGVPEQASIMVGSKYGDPSFRKKYIEYDPEQAKKLLDEMGLIDIDGDGFRERLDGGKLKLIMNTWDPAHTKIGELLEEYWAQVGIDVDMRMGSYSLYEQRCFAYTAELAIGWYHNADLAFEKDPGLFAPTPDYVGIYRWPAWRDWVRTGGESGMEPPEDVKKLIELAEIVMYSVDDDERLKAGRELVRAQSENLWSIGIVGQSPRPVIIDKDLKNIPETGYWGGAPKWLKPYYPEQTYLDE